MYWGDEAGLIELLTNTTGIEIDLYLSSTNRRYQDRRSIADKTTIFHDDHPNGNAAPCCP